ncbi:MAG TPA: hypothetical protein VGI75_13475 [Pirellulales bacterium]|jgi:hypothetical protein
MNCIYCRAWSLLFSIALAFLTIVAADCLADDSPRPAAKADETPKDLKVIKPEDAKDYEGKEVTVEFKVAAARQIDSGVCFLNSTTDRDDPKGFTVYMLKTAAAKYKEDPKTASPAEYFGKKKIRVSGTIKAYHEKYEIEVSSPKQITIVEDADTVEKKS